VVKSTAALSLIKAIQSFEPYYNHGDYEWAFYFKIKSKWRSFHAKKYKETMYIFCAQLDSLEIQENGDTNRELHPEEQRLVAECTTQINSIFKMVKKNPIAYHRMLQKSLPPGLRKGVISRKFMNQLIPDHMAFHKEFSASEMKQIMDFLHCHQKDTAVEAPTAGLYFEYCRIAYLANRENKSSFYEKLDTKMTGQEMYKRWADGRDGGLSELPLDSSEAFQAWYNDKTRMGDHPWEIYRGGNSTHIDLAVVNEYNSWKIKLIAFSSTRLVEACRIALALHKAKLPFELVHAESYRKRLCAEDNIGVLPEDDSIAYGWHRFPEEFNVADCIHYSWFKDDQNKSLLPMVQIKSLITWFPLRPLSARTSTRGISYP
jgi:hypothetical protein